MRYILLILFVAMLLPQSTQANNQDSLKAAELVQSKHPEDRILKVSAKKNSQSQYRVKVLKKSGKVVTLDVDTDSQKVVEATSKNESSD